MLNMKQRAGMTVIFVLAMPPNLFGPNTCQSNKSNRGIEMIYNTYDAMLQNGESESDALDYAQGMCWGEVECQESNIKYANYVGIVNDTHVYYDFGADYYFFCPNNDEQMETI
jgi:hypothetical protein